MIILFIFYFVIGLFVATVVVAKALHDSHQIKLREEENKKSQVLVHAMGGLLVALCLFFLCLSTWGIVDIGTTFKMWLIFLNIYWLSFDIVLNWFRGKDLFSVGETDLIDKAFRKLALKVDAPVEKLAVAIKLIVLAILLKI